jgi:membrane protease YdiL (CAAX protease family)
MKPFPAVLPSIGWILLYLLLQVIAGGVVTGMYMAMEPGALEAMRAGPGDVDDLALVAVPVLWSLVASGTLLMGLIWVNLRKDDRVDRIGLSTAAGHVTAPLLGVGILLIAATYGANYLYQTYVFPGVELQGDIDKLLKSIPATPLNLIAKVAAIVVIAPVIEEVLFRGYLQNALMRHMPPLAAIAVAALAFGVIHFQPYALLPLALLGAAFGYIYHRTGSLYANILLHAANNAIALGVLTASSS